VGRRGARAQRGGALTLIDLDHVAESNINRQAHALEDTLGMAKVSAMAARIEGIDPPAGSTRSRISSPRRTPPSCCRASIW
jgi:tRNA A37 threonylcarbamoyladenosine dehydratase